MKAINHHFKSFFMLLLFSCASIYAQQDQQPYVSVTTMHWNLDLEDFSNDEWLAVEKEYHEKVTAKNEHILSASVLRHYLTDDSSEVVFVTVFGTWEAFELASKRTNELIEQGWPNEEERKAFFKKRGKYYANEHSDEIYRSIPGANRLEDEELPLFYYVKTSYFSFPEDGTNKEFSELLDQYNKAVTHQNQYYKAYYPQVHFYGQDRTEFVEVFLTETLASLEKGLSEQGVLFRAHWADESEREAFTAKFDKYFTGKHNDRIYSSVPELYKPMPAEE